MPREWPFGSPSRLCSLTEEESKGADPERKWKARPRAPATTTLGRPVRAARVATPAVGSHSCPLRQYRQERVPAWPGRRQCWRRGQEWLPTAGVATRAALTGRPNVVVAGALGLAFHFRSGSAPLDSSSVSDHRQPACLPHGHSPGSDWPKTTLNPQTKPQTLAPETRTTRRTQAADTQPARDLWQRLRNSPGLCVHGRCLRFKAFIRGTFRGTTLEVRVRIP